MSVSRMAGGVIETGQMVCIEFSTRAGRAVRLLGYLSEATEEHLLVEALEGSTTRPQPGERVSFSALIGRTVQQASTTVLVSGDARRLTLRRPLALLEGDRRRHERVGVHLPLDWFEIEQGPDPMHSGQTLDVSISGAQFETDRTMVAVGTRIVAMVRLAERRLAGIAEVRSCRETDTGAARVGVLFVALADLDKAALAHLAQ
jgi:hypothetical protein